ncbi:MAG: alanine racemase [Candidatus Aminicenantes bacterium RBG_19FT_COMBO_58_17]|nr:MAG: alanine racemase [Candidatus Aminicenantes bacterium RBG_19FT_COMBO_58_17]
MNTPRLEIDLAKIGHNVREMVRLYGAKGVGIIGVTKGVLGDPIIADVFVRNGISILADSRIANLQRMREAGIRATRLLLRMPTLSEADAVVRYADISLNSEVAVIRELSKAAMRNGVRHKVILMVELGDLREGLMPRDLEEAVKETVSLEGVRLAGIGSNLSCFGGVKPDENNMSVLSSLAQEIENSFKLRLEFVSIGCSTVYSWLKSVAKAKNINFARIGDALLLGGRDLEERGIPGLYYDAFALVAEVIESKIKPSVPYGEIGLDAFGTIPTFADRGIIRRAILNIGRQDVLYTQIYPRIEIDILGASSDHLIADAKKTDLKVGDEVKFDLDYGAMLQSMTSPYVAKVYLNRTA